MPFRLIYITAGDEAEARQIGRALVEEGLVACVNIHPIQAVYRWAGEIEEAGEFAMLAKTRVELVDRVIDRVRELHSAEVPCVLSLPVDDGNPAFLEWIKESTGGRGDVA